MGGDWVYLCLRFSLESQVEGYMDQERLESGQCRKCQSQDVPRCPQDVPSCGWLVESCLPCRAGGEGWRLLRMTYSAGRVKQRQRDSLKGSTRARRLVLPACNLPLWVVCKVRRRALAGKFQSLEGVVCSPGEAIILLELSGLTSVLLILIQWLPAVGPWQFAYIVKWGSVLGRVVACHKGLPSAW